MIPKFIHFITGFGNDDFGLIEYVAVASARKHHPDWKIFIWHGDNVGGDWWDKLDELHVQKTWVQTPTHFRGKEVPHHAHRADLLRLPILYAHGGLYLDTDTITLAEIPESFLENRIIIARETNADFDVLGLCNAVFLCAPLDEFIGQWMHKYETFNPERWGEHSVELPWKMLKPLMYGFQFPDKFLIAHQNLLGYMPFEFERYWKQGTIMPCIIAHLWRTFSKPYMDKVTIESCAKRETAYEYHAAEVLSL